MKLLSLTYLVLLSISLFSNTLKGRIVRVIDGDTIVLLDSLNVQHKIRLDGIDCPEKGQPFGSVATKFVKDISKGKFATIHYTKKDRYRRVLGVLIVDSVDVNKELLRNGLAWHYKHFNNDSIYSQLEQDARDKKLNLWSDKSPIEPYYWRKGKRE